MDSIVGVIAGIIVVVLVLILVISNIHIVQQSRAYVVERLGAWWQFLNMNVC